MPVLKKVTLINCDAESVNVMGIKSSLFKELYVHTEDVLNFTQFFKNYTTMKHIAISGKHKNPQAFQHLQLLKLQLYNNGNVFFLRDVIAHQPKLKYLNLLFNQKDPHFAGIQVNMQMKNKMHK